MEFEAYWRTDAAEKLASARSGYLLHPETSTAGDAGADGLAASSKEVEKEYSIKSCMAAQSLFADQLALEGISWDSVAQLRYRRRISKN